MASGRKENQLYLSSSGVFGPNLRFITFPVPLWLIWKQAALFFKCFCVCSLFFVVVSLFNRWLSALSQSLSWTSFKARAELVWISPDPTCSIRNISFEGSVTSPLILQPWFWFKNWRKSLVSPREVKWNTFLWVEGYLFGSWLPLRLNFSNAGGFPVYMHLSLSSGKEGIGLYTVCFMIFLTTSLQGTHIQTTLPLASRIAPGSQTVFFSAWPPSLRVGVWLGLFK